jgi:hypothetical protein
MKSTPYTWVRTRNGFITLADFLSNILSDLIEAPRTIRESIAVKGDLFFAASNANSYDVSNATFDDCVKLCTY